jgi:hypothetical protein
MACHTVNMPFRALKLGYPTVVEYELGSRYYPETFPKTTRIRFEFPEREGLPPLKFWWYDGNPNDPLKPLRPDALRLGEGRRMEWDGPNMRSPNIPEAAQYVKRTYRPGWEP